MRRLLTGLLVVALCAGFCGVVYAETISISFETAEFDADWEIEGAVLSADQHVSGAKSLFLGKGSTATYIFSPTDVYGTVTMWVYDKGITSDSERKHGARWGLVNSFGDKFVICLNWAPFLDGNARYAHIATSENAWYNRWSTNLFRSPGWHKFTFIHTDENTLKVIMDDQYDAQVYPPEKLKFQYGFNGVYFYGGDASVPDVYIDDIQIDYE